MNAATHGAIVLGVLVSCLAVTNAALTRGCTVDGTRTVEERTNSVPLVIKGILVGRSHAGDRVSIRVGKVLKGKKLDVSVTLAEVLGSTIDAVVLLPQSAEPHTTVGGSSSSSSSTSDRHITTDSWLNINNTRGINDDDDATTVESSTLDARDEWYAAADARGGSAPASAPVCLDGVDVFSRHIFFLRLPENEDQPLEVAEDGVPQSRDNMRKVRMAVKKEKKSNVTLRITIPDTHYAPCEKGSTFDNEYCMNGGDCALWININTHFCKCHHPFVGSRCEILDPGISQNPEGEPVSIPFTVTIMLGALLFLTLICGVAYIRYKSSVWRERTKQLEKALKYLNVNGRYPIPTSRRESPVGGVLMYKANSQIPNTDGTEHVLLDIKDRDACNNSSRHGSLASNQYRLLASEDKQATAPVETPVTSHRASINSIETQLPNKQSHSSIV